MNWQKFAPETTSRVRENTEWSITYHFNTADTALPRILLIGDSICNAYNGLVAQKLAGKANTSSRCVTDRDYFRELDYVLDSMPYTAISFNNGLHSLSTNRKEWDTAYRAAVDFIRTELPDVYLSLTLSTPLKDPALTALSADLNRTVLLLSQEHSLPVIDLFTPMNCLDREEYWSDTYHFRPQAIDMQAEIIAAHMLAILEK